MEPVENIFKLCNHLQTREPTETDHRLLLVSGSVTLQMCRRYETEFKPREQKLLNEASIKLPSKRSIKLFNTKFSNSKFRMNHLKLLDDYFQFCPIYCRSFVSNLVSATLIISTAKAAYFIFNNRSLDEHRKRTD